MVYSLRGFVSGTGLGTARWALAGMTWIALVLASPAAASEAPPENGAVVWHNLAGLGLTSVSGNSSSTNLSLSDTLSAQWPKTKLELRVRALRVESGTRELTPNFDEPAQPVLEVRRSESLTSEEYGLRLRVNQTVSQRLGWFVAGNWERNRPAGLLARTAFGGGLSYSVSRKDAAGAGHSLQFEAGFDGTLEEPVSGPRKSYLGSRLAAHLDRDLSRTSRLEGSMELLQNLEQTEDLRVNVDAALSTAINERLALRVSYQLNYDRQPQTRTFPNPQPELGPDLFFEFDEVDSVFSTSLVMKW